MTDAGKRLDVQFAQLLEIPVVQRLAEASYVANGMPIGIVDARDGSVLVGCGWQEICLKFHRAHPRSLERCRESDLYLASKAPAGIAATERTCANGLRDVGIPIMVAGEHMATLFLGQFFYEGETPDRAFFVRQAREFGYDEQAYLAALDRVPVLGRAVVENIIAYNTALARFLADLAEASLRQHEGRRALRRSQARFCALIEKATDIILVLDRGGRIQFWSPSATEALGWTEGEAEGRVAFRFVHDDDRARVVDAFRVGDAEGPPQRARFRARHKDGSCRLLEAVARDLLDDSAVRGIVVNARDVTEQQRIEEQFRQAQRLESLGRLASGVAHDFNNLLTVILSCAEALKADLADGVPAGAEEVAEIQHAAGRARDLTRQLLAFARRQPIAPEALDLNALLGGSEKLLRRLLTEDIALTVERQPGLWQARCDPGQIEQVVMNLAVNARDAMPGGGALRIATANVHLGAGGGALQPGEKPGEYVRLEVADSGIGMSEEVKANLFEPFFTTKDVGCGTGLGLATVHGIVHQNGGHIRVRSQLGRGATFEILLPRAGAATPLAGTLRRAPASRGTEAVLLVEDDPAVRRVAASTLRGAGYRVTIASCGQEALALGQESLDALRLLITDVVMLAMDGHALAEELRRTRPDLRVLFVSGYPSDVLGEHGLSTEVELLPKPFTPASLLARVRSALDRPSEDAETDPGPNAVRQIIG